MGRPRPISKRGRPPKNAESAQRLALMRKPKYLYSRQKQTNKLNSSNGSYSKSRKSKKPPWEGESDEDDYMASSFSRLSGHSEFFDDDDEEDRSILSFNDESGNRNHDEEEEFDEENGLLEDESSTSLSQPSSSLNMAQLKIGRILRAKSPPIYDEEELKNMPPLNLPPSSADLLLPPHLSSKYILKIISIYEILNQFKFQLRLPSFKLEDFIASLRLNEMNSLLSEVHICLLKTLIREDDSNATHYGSQDIKDSIGIYMYCCDHMTWPSVLRMFLGARRREEGKEIKEIIQALLMDKKNEEYPVGVTLDIKLKVLQYCCDTFLESNISRDEIMNGDGGVRHDDHCRRCHKLGDLLCCDRCSSVWHLQCLDPPIEEVPDDEWICSVCKQMAKENLCDDGTIFSDDEGLFLRRYILGYDRHGNKYWWLCRRLIVEFDAKNIEKNENGEKEEKAYYYSTKRQFLEVVKGLDKDNYEKDLYSILSEIKEECFVAMEKTEKMTKEALKSTEMSRSMKSWIEQDNGLTELWEDDEKKNPDEKDNQLNIFGEGILTRLKTGSLKEKNFLSNDKNSDDDRDSFMVDDENNGEFLIKVTKKEAVQRGILFKLGMEGRNYVNTFTNNPLALNKHQHAEERDKKRHLSHKFSLTTASEFKWQGATLGLLKTTIPNTLRQTLVHFESLLVAPFMHPNWSLHRQNWLKAVSMCTHPKDFSLALSILESSIKPVLFNPAWNESLGHTILDRNTLLEREERKKDEKRERREFMEEQEMIIRCTGGIKYSLMPHRGLQQEKGAGGQWYQGFGYQGSIGFGTTGGVGEGGGRGVQALWKQRGEEYRVSGKGGWMWYSFTRIRQTPYNDGLREANLLCDKNKDENIIVEETINISEDLKKARSERKYYQKYRPFKTKRKGLKTIDNFLNRRILLQEALIKQKKEKEEKELEDMEKIKKINNNEETFATQCYSPLCRNGEVYNELKCYAFDCRKQKAEGNVKSEKKDDETKEVIEVKNESKENEIKKKVEVEEEKEKANEEEETFNCKEKVYLFKVERRSIDVANEDEKKLTICKIAGKRSLGKGQLPPCCRFTTNIGKKKSIFVLPKYELKKLSRTGALREVSGFSYAGKFNKYIWPYGIAPRPLFRYCWRWRNVLPDNFYNLNIVAHQMRVLWACIRWDDMQVKAPPSGNNTITTENEVITSELLKRRDLAPFGIKSEYLVRKIIVPLINDESYENGGPDYQPKDDGSIKFSRRIREGLRERKKKNDEEEERRRRGPIVTETWIGEEELELWEIKMFGEKLEKQQQMKENEKIRKQMEEGLKKQREELKAKRLLQQQANGTNNKFTSLITGTPKRIFATKSQITTSITAITTPANHGYAMLKTNSGKTYQVPLSAIQGKAVGQQIMIKTGGAYAPSTTATIISTFTPSSNTIGSTSTTITPVTTTLSTPTTIKFRNVSGTSTPLNTTTVRPIILSQSQTSTITTNNGQRIQIIKPVSSVLPQGVLKTTTPTIQTTVSTTSTQQTQGSTQSIQIPIRFSDGRMQIIQIPFSMLSSSPIQIAIPSSASQSTNQQTVTVTSTKQIVNTTSAVQSAQQQSVKVIGNSTALTSTSSSTTASPLPQISSGVVTRIIQMKNNQPQTISYPATPTTTQQVIAEQIAQQIKSGNIQLRINQGTIQQQQGQIIPSSISNSSSSSTPTLIPTQTPNPTLTSTTTTSSVITASIGGTVDNSVRLSTPNLLLNGSLSGSTLITSGPSTNQVLISTSTTATGTGMNITGAPVTGNLSGTRILVQPSTPSISIHKVATPSLKVISPPQSTALKKTDTVTSTSPTFVVTPQITNEIVRHALLNSSSSSPEVQQKLLALQRQAQQQTGKVIITQPTALTPTARGITGSRVGRGRGLKRTRQLNSTLPTSNLTHCPNSQVNEEKNQMLICQQVLKSLVDRIEKAEKLEIKRKRMKEVQLQHRWKSLISRNETNLAREVELLKREINRKRNSLETSLRKEIEKEIDQKLNLKRKEEMVNNKSNNNSEGAAKRRKTEINNNNGDNSINSNKSCNQVSSTKLKLKTVSSNSNFNSFNSVATSTSSPSVTTTSSTSSSNSPTLSYLSANANTLTTIVTTSISSTISTSSASKNSNKKLYCICKTPYDPSRFMVGCEVCHNWFHGDCLKLDEEKVQKRKSWICDGCRENRAENDKDEDEDEYEDEDEDEDEDDEEYEDEINEDEVIDGLEDNEDENESEENESNLKKRSDDAQGENDETGKVYCICKQPYDESLFYIQCDSCQQWFHGKCVGIISKEAQLLETYNCPSCDPSSMVNYCNQKKLDSKDLHFLKMLLKELKSNKNSRPFLNPVDASLVPDYYKVIKKPMDLSTIEKKLESSSYSTLATFIGDVTLICDNCRYFNDAKSSFTTCANLLESFFLQRIKTFRQQMSEDK